MFEIKGKVNTALCYASVMEDEAAEQILRICDQEFAANSRIRIMPDVTAGEGCTVGTTMTIEDKVVPSIVGVDIGCGMYTVKLENKDIDLKKVDEAAHFIPSGKNVWGKCEENFDLSSLRCRKNLKDPDRLERSLGTLGGGNHFIEIDRSQDGSKYLVIHSGSRGLDNQTAKFYQNKAVILSTGKYDYLEKRKALIEKYREEGRHREIQQALDEMEQEYNNGIPSVPKELCWLCGKYLDDYLHDVKICQSFARRNREKIAEIILDYIRTAPLSGFHTIHNYIDTERMILRKGAVSAEKGELILIPINMKDGSILALGKGNEQWNYSAPHGAGRVMSRKKARASINIEEYRKAMEGIYTTSVNEFTIDEAPMAYKSLNDIIDIIGGTAEVLEVLKPIYNFKAPE